MLVNSEALSSEKVIGSDELDSKLPSSILKSLRCESKQVRIEAGAK